eukprot:11353532-Alexandrium_andersonii.AAC.1
MPSAAVSAQGVFDDARSAPGSPAQSSQWRPCSLRELLQSSPRDPAGRSERASKKIRPRPGSVAFPPQNGSSRRLPSSASGAATGLASL